MGERVGGNKHVVAVQVDPYDDGGAASGRSRHGRRAPPAASWPNTCAVVGWLAFIVCGTICLVVLKYMAYLSFPVFSVHLTGYDGIGPAGGPVAAVLSPEFNLSLRLRNTCVDRADLAVLYSGVVLGWATMEPRDCAGKRWNRALEVAARGDGVGLSDQLRDRLSLEWSNGTVELDVDVKVFRGKRAGGVDSGLSDVIPTKAIICKVILHEKQDQPMSACTWTELRPIVELI
jgi:hypothetical protein